MRRDGVFKVGKNQCEACGCVIGDGYMHGFLTNFRGHELCSHCTKDWKGKESKVGRKVDYGEFIAGIKK